jgi:hypothetical protein
MSTAVPVRIPIPPDALPCDDSRPSDVVLWRLEVSAQVPGVDYASTFEVPVFRTVDSEQPRTEVEMAAAHALAEQAEGFQPGPECRIRVTRNRRGTEIVFPPARNRGAAAGLTLFLLLWLGATAATVLLGAPIVFPIVFGLFAVLLAWLVLDQWLGVSRITAGDGALSVTDPSSNAPGHLVNGAFSLPQALKASATSAAGTGSPAGRVSGSPLNVLTYSGPTSNDAVTFTFTQDVGASDALRTGTYSKTLTFTLSTTNP